MTSVASIKNDLEEFGLSKNQSEIYLLLIARGNLRISEIVRTSQIPRSSVYESLKALLKLGLTQEIIENSFKSFRAYPFEAMRHSLQERIVDLQKQTKDIDDLSKALSRLPEATESHSPVVRYYKSRSGARQIYWNSLKAEDTIYVHSEYGRSSYVGKKFYMDFVSESYARNIKEKILTNPTPNTLRLIKRDTGTPLARSDTTNIRIIDEASIEFRGDTLMYDNIYAQVYLKNEEINGFEIESQQFVDTQRAIFETLWDSASPIKQFLK